MLIHKIIQEIALKKLNKMLCYFTNFTRDFLNDDKTSPGYFRNISHDTADWGILFYCTNS